MGFNSAFKGLTAPYVISSLLTNRVQLAEALKQKAPLFIFTTCMDEVHAIQGVSGGRVNIYRVFQEEE